MPKLTANQQAVVQLTSLLTSVETSRLLDARSRLLNLGLPHLTAHLLDRWDTDGLVAALQLSQAIDNLEEAGVPATKLISKLRGDHDFWPTWSEIVAASHLQTMTPNAKLTYEPGKKDGRHPDFHLSTDLLPEDHPVEFKAIGLSDQEVAFCRRAAGLFRPALPNRGFVTIHAPIDVEEIAIDPAALRAQRQGAEQLVRHLPLMMSAFAGICVTAIGAEDRYLKRALSRIREASQQFPAGESGYVGIHWTNGAPRARLAELLSQAELPENVVGVALIGSAIVIPQPVLHNLVLFVPRGSDGSEQRIQSSVDTEEGVALLLQLIEQSSGVRAIRLRGSTRGKRPELIRRAGSHRILPFTLLFGPDPEDLHR